MQFSPLQLLGPRGRWAERPSGLRGMWETGGATGAAKSPSGYILSKDINTINIHYN